MWHFVIWFRGHMGVCSKAGLDLGGVFQSFDPLIFCLRSSCASVVLSFGQSFWRSASAKSTLRLKAGVQPWSCDFCDAEGTPRTATTLSEPCQPPHPPVLRVVSPFHTLASRRDPGSYSQARPLAFPPPLRLLELGWSTEMEPGRNTELCPVHQPFVVSLGHHRDGGSSFTNTVLQRSSGQSESCWVQRFCCRGWGWNVLSLPTSTCTPLIWASPG